MPSSTIAKSLLLPELKLLKARYDRGTMLLWAVKRSVFEVCPKCGARCEVVYDHRQVEVRDAPVRTRLALLRIRKRRFYCKRCRKPFTEPVDGIRKGYRTTQRYRKDVRWACENFTDLKRVRKQYRCSCGLVQSVLYEQLELERRRKVNYPWPKKVGIDEHFFRRYRGTARPEFASLIVDYTNKRIFEVVQGKTVAELNVGLSHIPGRENVQNVVLDLCDPFKRFVTEFFPNAQIVADKFHVLRLLTPHINRRRKAIAGDRRRNPIGRLLLKNGKHLDYFKRKAVYAWLDEHPELRELYHWKEAMHGFYRVKGYYRASKVLTRMTDQMALSNLPEIKRLRRTLMKWRKEILNYFRTKLTNARTEAYNNVAKLIQKRAFGYRSFVHYRLRLLNATA